MNHEITLEQVKERLVPVLQQLSLQAIGSRKRELEDIYTLLSSLFLDISVTADNQDANHVRNTQFQGFAKLLVEELTSLELDYMGVVLDESGGNFNRYYRTEWEKIIARHAYDLAKHIIEHTEHKDLDVLSPDEHVQRIPDITREDNNA